MPYIGQGLTEGRRRVETFIATANQTTFNIIYDAGYVDVYQNGILLAEADYTATNGSQVVLAVGAALNDEITIIAHQLFSVTDTVSAAQGGTFTGAITASGGVVGNITGQVSDISNHLIDEDNMASNDDTKVPSQQSVKAYVDTEVQDKDKPYVLRVAELIYSKVDKIKKENSEMTNIQAFEVFMTTKDYDLIS